MFPALRAPVNAQRPAYLDNASTTQKPQAVIDALVKAYACAANVHRGVHAWSARATERHEATRAAVARFVGGAPDEIVFTSGTTDGLNLLAYGLEQDMAPGDRVLVSALEHHSNLVPWQAMCAKRGAELRVAPLDPRGQLDRGAFEAELSARPPKIVAVSHTSNALGTTLPIAWISARAKAVGATVIVDGAQAAPHRPIDVGALGCDAYVFSAHKMYGPEGVGVLWARRTLLAELRPFRRGGDMIESVSFERTVIAAAPAKFEAGTPNIAGVQGLGAAVDFLALLDRDQVAAHEARLTARCLEGLRSQPGVRVVGEDLGPDRGPVVSFLVEGVHPHDVGTVLDQQGVAVRSGHHCAEPLMDALDLEGGTVRASFALYNCDEDVERLLAGVDLARRSFA